MAAGDISIRFAAEGDQTLKSAISAIDAQMKALNEQVNASTEGMKDMATAEDASAKKTEALGGIVAAGEQKMKLLSQQYEQAKGKLDQLATALQKAQESGDPAAIEKATTAYNKQSATVSKLEGAMAKTEGQIAKATNEINKSGTEAEKTEGKMDKLANALSVKLAQDSIQSAISGLEKLGGALINAGKQVFDMAAQASTFADDLLTQSTQTGLSTQALQEYAYASRFVDTELSTITGSLTKLTKNMASGSKDVATAFNTLGVSTTDSSGKMRNAQDVFWDAIDALGNVENATQRDQLAMALFGKSAQELNPLITAGSGEWKKYAKEAQSAGLILKDDTVGALGTFNDSLQRIDATMEAAQRQIMGALAPAMTTLTNFVVEAAQKFTAWIQTDQAQAYLANLAETIKTVGTTFLSNLQPAVNTAIGFLNNAGSAFETLRSVADKVGKVITVLVTAWAGLKAAMAALQIAALVTNPMGLVVAGIGALVTAIGVLVTNWGTVKNAGAAAWDAIKSAWSTAASWFQTIATTIVNTLSGIPDKIKGFFSSAWRAVQTAWNNAASWFTTIGTNIVNAFNAIPQKIGQLFTNAWNNVKNAWQTAQTWFTTIGTNIVNAFNAIPQKIGQLFTSAWANVRNAWSNVASHFSQIGTQIINAIRSSISGLSNQALGWARDMMDGFGRGISNYMSRVTQPVKNLAAKIRSFLHFSRPDEGPLRDYETWMPDFVGGLAKTLNASSPLLDRAVADLAGGIREQASGMQISAAAGAAAQPPIILQVDGKTFARLMTPYIDVQQAQTWGAKMALGV